MLQWNTSIDTSVCTTSKSQPNETVLLQLRRGQAQRRIQPLSTMRLFIVNICVTPHPLDGRRNIFAARRLAALNETIMHRRLHLRSFPLSEADTAAISPQPTEPFDVHA